ncbi:MAG: hypothetical protein ABSC08_20140 [Bryobacteraceae bacterium]|jgi:hypothetical protein
MKNNSISNEPAQSGETQFRANLEIQHSSFEVPEKQSLLNSAVVAQLHSDINSVWSRFHLTQNHTFRILTDPFSSGGEMRHYMEKYGEPWTVTEPLIHAMRDIWNKYQFDALEVSRCPCCDEVVYAEVFVNDITIVLGGSDVSTNYLNYIKSRRRDSECN